MPACFTSTKCDLKRNRCVCFCRRSGSVFSHYFTDAPYRQSGALWRTQDEIKAFVRNGDGATALRGRLFAEFHIQQTGQAEIAENALSHRRFQSLFFPIGFQQLLFCVVVQLKIFLCMHGHVQIPRQSGAVLKQMVLGGKCMSEICTGEQRNLFCRTYLRTMDPQRAAETIGKADGFAVLRNRRIRRQLESMRQAAAEQILREDAIRRLTELAFGRANDAVKLAAALSTGETSELERLELSSVGELKLTDKGVEIKFIDRVRALEALCGLLGDGSQKDAAEFFRALEDAGEGV